VKLGALRLAALGIVPIALFAGCPSDNASVATGGTGGQAPGGGGKPSDGASEAEAGPTWDPVWHETAPKDWQSVGPENNPDCGVACRVALNVPMTNPATFGHAYTTGWLISGCPTGLCFSKVGSTTTLVMADGPGSQLEQSVWADYVSYVRNFGPGDGQVEVTSLITGETKIAFRYTPATAGDYSVNWTILNSKYVFWELKGLTALNLQTGEVHLVGPACGAYWATETGVICAGGELATIDPETNTYSVIDSGGELQTDSNISPDRQKLVWVDYRDPPGPGSTGLFKRNGGEIYLRDLSAGTTKRLTFDSPDNPRGKIQPAVGTDVVVWNEVPLSQADLNPTDGQVLYAAADALAKLDLTTGERCQYDAGQNPIPLFGYKSVHGHHAYGQWFDLPTQKTWLVDLDLDDPALNWQCTMTPGW
jgi:hypothetical protein